MWASVIAVLGTLAGAALSAAFQHRALSVQTAAARQEKRRADQLAAVSAFATALADHRRAMWLREQSRLSGGPVQQTEQARAASHATRSALTSPHVTVTILLPHLKDHADTAVKAAYSLRAARHLDQLAALRSQAVAATEKFLDAARAALA